MLFYGTQNIQLDDKNRMRIPIKYRIGLGNSFRIFQWAEDCLCVMGEEAFENYFSSLTKIPYTDAAGQNALKAIYGTVDCPEEDNQGRFVLNQRLKKLADIEKKVVFLGLGDRIEIWSEERYENKDIGKAGSVDRALEAMKAYNV